MGTLRILFFLSFSFCQPSRKRRNDDPKPIKKCTKKQKNRKKEEKWRLFQPRRKRKLLASRWLARTGFKVDVKKAGATETFITNQRVSVSGGVTTVFYASLARIANYRPFLNLF